MSDLQIPVFLKRRVSSWLAPLRPTKFEEIFRRPEVLARREEKAAYYRRNRERIRRRMKARRRAAAKVKRMAKASLIV